MEGNAWKGVEVSMEGCDTDMTCGISSLFQSTSKYIGHSKYTRSLYNSNRSECITNNRYNTLILWTSFRNSGDIVK